MPQNTQSKARQPRRVSDLSPFLTKLLLEESECGAVVLSVAYLDATLENALRTWTKPELASYFGGFLRHYGPKWQLAHALDLITDEQAKDFELVGNVRNAFAHDLEKGSFQSPAVKDNWRFSLLKDQNQAKMLDDVVPRLPPRPLQEGRTEPVSREKAAFLFQVSQLVLVAEMSALPAGTREAVMSLAHQAISNAWVSPGALLQAMKRRVPPK